eukprot:TRINITY_DN1565_c0_g1_i1.p1 TRINITY_DN1565_c0_g1~~TRINITY_DN1565_c0_g1_i1.p1  ORF type:complete len:285 (+),score=85.82 TRINITY_DN1565_c0_g1_i1:325-1179(+)
MAATRAASAAAGRSIAKVVMAREQSEGDGARVRRSIGSAALPDLDPFLLLDEFRVSPPAGFPTHPHRGMQTVTYMLEGAFWHKDNRGHAGTIGPGSLQWMLAGSGLQHSEMPATDGPNVGLQLWLTLPAADKMSPPDYQEVSADAVPTATSPDGAAHVRILAGDAYGVSAAVVTTSPILYLDVDVDAGGAATLPVPDGYVGFAYVLCGTGTFGANGVAAEHGSCCLLADGEAGSVTATAGAGGLRFVLVAGTPVREPIVKYGPFVMNTREEVVQAIEDYRLGRF